MALSTGVMLGRGIRRRCPVCGQNKLFRRWIAMADNCPRCGLTFQRVPGQWLGSWFLNICLAQVLVIGIVLGGSIAAYPDPPLLLLGLVGGAVTVLFPIWFFPYSRMIWVAIDLAMRPLEFEEGVDPQWELATDAATLARERAAVVTATAGDGPTPDGTATAPDGAPQAPTTRRPEDPPEPG